MDAYMHTRSYDELNPIASVLNETENTLSEIRSALSTLYPDTSRIPTTQADYEEAVNNFESAQKRLIAILDTLLP